LEKEVLAPPTSSKMAVFLYYCICITVVPMQACQQGFLRNPQLVVYHLFHGTFL